MSNAVRCATCLHPDRINIDTLLASGKTYRQVSAAFNISPRSLQRHKQDGHARGVGPHPAPTAAQAAVANALASTITTGGPVPDTAQGMIEAIIASLNAVDLSTLPVRAQMDVIRERRLAAEALSKLGPAGAPSSDAEERVRALTDILAVYDDALDALPVEQRQAIAAITSPRLQALKAARP